MIETYTHRVARIQAEYNFNSQNMANGGLVKDAWNYLTPAMQKIFIDQEMEKMIDEEDEQERIHESGQFGAGA